MKETGGTRKSFWVNRQDNFKVIPSSTIGIGTAGYAELVATPIRGEHNEEYIITQLGYNFRIETPADNEVVMIIFKKGTDTVIGTEVPFSTAIAGAVWFDNKYYEITGAAYGWPEPMKWVQCDPELLMFTDESDQFEVWLYCGTVKSCTCQVFIQTMSRSYQDIRPNDNAFEDLLYHEHNGMIADVNSY